MDKIYYLIILAGILLLLFLLYKNRKHNSIKSNKEYIQANTNKKEYLVQKFNDKQNAANILGEIESRIQLLKDYFEENMNKYPEFKPYLKQFCDRIKNLTLQETDSDSEYTSYTINKGDEISLCLRSKKIGELHDINLIMYVVLHELSHVACPEKNHTELFKKIFIFFIKIASVLKIYQIVDYQIDPHEYCGLVINEHLQ